MISARAYCGGTTGQVPYDFGRLFAPLSVLRDHHPATSDRLMAGLKRSPVTARFLSCHRDLAQIIRALRRRSRRDSFDVHQDQQSCQLLRLSDRGMTVMDKPAVLECSYQKPNGQTIQTGKLVLDLDSSVVSSIAIRCA